MDLSQTTITLGSIIAIVGCFIGVMNFFSGRTKNSKEDEKRLVRIEAKLDTIEQNTSDTKNKLQKVEEKLENHETRITVIEKSKGGKNYDYRRN